MIAVAAAESPSARNVSGVLLSLKHAAGRVGEAERRVLLASVADEGRARLTREPTGTGQSKREDPVYCRTSFAAMGRHHQQRYA